MTVLEDPGDHPERGGEGQRVHHDGLQGQNHGAEGDEQQDQHDGDHEEAHPGQA